MDSRITIEPGKRFGQPRIRGLRITVWDILNWLAAGMTEQQIIDDYPELDSVPSTSTPPVSVGENLFGKLATRLADLYPGSLHLADVSMLEAPDSAGWAYAKTAGLVIVTADSDSSKSHRPSALFPSDLAPPLDASHARR